MRTAVLVVALVLALAACGGEEDAPAETVDDTDASCAEACAGLGHPAGLLCCNGSCCGCFAEVPDPLPAWCRR